MMSDDGARAKLQELETERDQLIAEAQRRIAFLDGSIATIKTLLDPPEPAIAPDIDAIERAARFTANGTPEVIDAPTEAAQRA